MINMTIRDYIADVVILGFGFGFLTGGKVCGAFDRPEPEQLSQIERSVLEKYDINGDGSINPGKELSNLLENYKSMRK